MRKAAHGSGFLGALFLVSAGVLGGCQKKYEQVSVTEAPSETEAPETETAPTVVLETEPETETEPVLRIEVDGKDPKLPDGRDGGC